MITDLEAVIRFELVELSPFAVMAITGLQHGMVRANPLSR